jgi:hypothetical protein
MNVPNGAGTGSHGSLSVSGSTFTNNTAAGTLAAAGGAGGAIIVLGSTQTGNTYTITKSTFGTNHATGGGAGGAIANAGSGPLTVNFSRFVNNTNSTTANGTAVAAFGSSTITANDNWWGTSVGPTGFTGNVSGGVVTAANWLQLKTSASPDPIVTNQTTTVTSSFLSDSANNPVTVANLATVIGLPITFSAVGGSISGAQTTIQASGTATATYTATAANASNSATGKVDNDPNSGSTNTGLITVNKGNTSASIISQTLSATLVGQSFSVSFNAVPSNTTNSPTAMTGNVTISDGVNSCNGVIDGSGNGSCLVTLNTTGARTLTAIYLGDGNFNASAASPGLGHTVTNTDTWTGATSTDWNTAGNWDFNLVPGTINDAVIPNVGAQPNVITPDVTINSLNIASGRTLTINNGHILAITGSTSSNLTLDGQLSGGELDFGAGTHTIGGAGSISSTNTTKVLSGATVSLSSDLQMGNLTINSGGTMNLSSHTLSLSGTPTPLTVSGTFNPAPPPAGDSNTARADVPESVSGTVLFNGTSAQNAPGITYGGLTISNSSGVTLTGDANVNRTLTLTSGDLATSTFTLTMPDTATSSGTTDVVGNVKRTGFATAACASAPCANTLSAGNPNNQITITAGTAPGSILVNMAKSAPATYAAAVQRNYTITPTGGSGITATLRLHYLVSELNGNTPESSLNLRRFNGTNWVAVVATQPVDMTNHWVESNAVTSFSQWTFSTLAPTAANGIVSGRITTSDGTPVEGTVINLNGGQTRKTITDANGFYQFDNVATNGFYTVTPSRVNYSFNPFNRSFSQLGEETEAVFGGAFTGDSANPLDTAEYFVRQQYVDLLGREPEEAGFNYWGDRILACQGEARCVSGQRTSVAAAFFIELEAQQTGAYIYDVYQGTLGRRPAFAEYTSDRPQVVGGASLDAEKSDFAQNFVQRPEFIQKYQSAMTAESFVDALIQNVEQGSGADLSSQRDSLVGTYNSGANLNQSRGFVVQAMADNATLSQANYNSAFVLTEYFGYLRRDPDQAGYNFWLNALNVAPGNYRGMVCSFVTSTEYQRRFSSVVSHTNGECGQQEQTVRPLTSSPEEMKRPQRAPR